MPSVDVIVVSYNSRGRLRACVESLVGAETIRVIIVDNASSDGSLDDVADLGVETIALSANGGFAGGCNAGWRAGAAPFVLFLNPDGRIGREAIDLLVRALDDETVGIVGPKIMDREEVVDCSQRMFPRLRSTYANAFYLNQVFRRASWASEIVRDPAAYERPASPEWISGACLLVRRSVLEQLGGWDDGFFMYCEDKDLCRRARDAGWDVRYEPHALAIHEGGASAPRSTLLPVLAASRVRYARKHRGRLGAELERVGIALTALTHALASRRGRATRAGHAASLRAVLRSAPNGRPTS